MDTSSFTSLSQPQPNLLSQFLLDLSSSNRQTKDTTTGQGEPFITEIVIVSDNARLHTTKTNIGWSSSYRSSSVTSLSRWGDQAEAIEAIEDSNNNNIISSSCSSSDLPSSPLSHTSTSSSSATSSNNSPTFLIKKDVPPIPRRSSTGCLFLDIPPESETSITTRSISAGNHNYIPRRGSCNALQYNTQPHQQQHHQRQPRRNSTSYDSSICRWEALGNASSSLDKPQRFCDGTTKLRRSSQETVSTAATFSDDSSDTGMLYWDDGDDDDEQPREEKHYCDWEPEIYETPVMF